MEDTYQQKLLRSMKNCPVTWFFFYLIVGLYLAVIVLQWKDRTNVFEARRKLGAVSSLVLFLEYPEDGSRKKLELHGQFELWDGQFWRMIATGYHHGGVFHLLCNGLGLIWLGSLLEPVMKKWSYALFIISATFVSILPEIYLEHDVVGISGGLCGMFGLLIILRHYYTRIDLMVDESRVRNFIVILLGMVIATELGVINIANVAHFTGLGYGVLCGIAFWGLPQWHLRGTFHKWYGTIFLAAHLILIPATYFAIQPFWNGRYHWYVAYELDELPETEKTKVTRQEEMNHLKKAVEIDPGLDGAWRQLAILYAMHEDYLQAWKTILACLKHNRSYDDGLDYARKLWNYMIFNKQGDQALKELTEQFGDETEDWISKLENNQEEEEIPEEDGISPNLEIPDMNFPEANEKQEAEPENDPLKPEQEELKKNEPLEIPDEASEGTLT